MKLVLPNQIDFYLNWRDFKRKHGKGHYDFYVATKIFPSGVNELAGKNYDFCHSNWHFGSTNVVNTRMLMDDIAFFRYVLVILLVSFGFFWFLLDSFGFFWMCVRDSFLQICYLLNVSLEQMFWPLLLLSSLCNCG